MLEQKLVVMFYLVHHTNHKGLAKSSELALETWLKRPKTDTNTDQADHGSV